LTLPLLFIEVVVLLFPGTLLLARPGVIGVMKMLLIADDSSCDGGGGSE